MALFSVFTMRFLATIKSLNMTIIHLIFSKSLDPFLNQHLLQLL
jgi:hypothetical protein